MNREPLTDDYCAAAMRDARQFSGTYDQGTSGTLAAHLARIILDRERLVATIEKLEAENAEMRAAVHARLSGVSDDAALVDLERAWEAHKARHAATMNASVLCPAVEHQRPRKVYAAPPAEDSKDASISPAEDLCHKTAAVIRDRRPKYGGPRPHFARTIGMINAAFADVLKRPLTESDWATIMILDKIARYRGPTSTVDGPVDIAGYAACLYEVSQPE